HAADGEPQPVSVRRTPQIQDPKQRHPAVSLQRACAGNESQSPPRSDSLEYGQQYQTTCQSRGRRFLAGSQPGGADPDQTGHIDRVNDDVSAPPETLQLQTEQRRDLL